MTRTQRRTIGLLLTSLAACSGDVNVMPQGPRSGLDDARGGATPGGRDDSDDSDEGDTPVNPGNPDGCGISYAPPRAVLLTPRQYVNLLKDVVGEQAVGKEDAASDDKLEFETVDLPRVTTATFDHALRLSERAVESLRGKSAGFLGCANAMDATCVKTKLASVARRAFKRKVANDELDELMKIYEQGKSVMQDNGETGVLAALQAILVSPSALYRTEFSGEKSAAVHGLSLHEQAAALAGLLLDSTPDEPLLAAADSGALADPKVLDQQIERLLALPRVRAHVTRVVLNAFKVNKLFETPKDATAFPEYTPALQASMYEETRRFVDHILWSDKPLKELLTSRTSFVDRNLAKLYGVNYSGNGSDFVQVELPEQRSGLLTQASVMSVLSRTEKTSVVARGLFVRGSLLCLPKVASPPMSIQAQIEEQLHAKSSERELAAYRAMTSPCKGCHAGFDAFGLLLEEFDAIGRHSGKPGQSVPLNGLGGFERELDDPIELARDKAEDGAFTSCITRRTLAYTLSVASQPLRAGCEPDSLTQDVIDRGGSMRDLIAAIALSPTFARRAEEEP